MAESAAHLNGTPTALPEKHLQCWDCRQQSRLQARPSEWGVWLAICGVCGAENWVSRTLYDTFEPVPGHRTAQDARMATATVTVGEEVA